MNPATIHAFVSGYLALGYAVASLFFVRFWRDTGDRLFALFASAFALLLLQRLVLDYAADSQRETTWAYVVRLLAFVLILIAIIDKNRVGSSAPP